MRPLSAPTDRWLPLQQPAGQMSATATRATAVPITPAAARRPVTPAPAGPVATQRPATAAAAWAALAAAAGLLLAACGFLPEETAVAIPELPEPPQVSAVITYEAVRGDIDDVIEGYARVSPVQETSLYFLYSGRVQVLNVAPQDQVARGDVLAQLEIQALAYQLELAQVDLEIAHANRERIEGQGVSRIDLRIHDLGVRRQELVVERLQQQIANATIRAPHDGIVRRVLVQAGDTVREYEPVIDIADATRVELQMTVSEEVYRSIDQAMAIEADIGGATWRPIEIVRMTHRDPRFDTSVRREEYVVHYTLPDTGGPAALYAQFPIKIYMDRRTDAVIIPSAALREFRDREYVRVLEDGIRREVDVRVGVRTATQVEIVEGLDAGALVIGR